MCKSLCGFLEDPRKGERYGQELAADFSDAAAAPTLTAARVLRELLRSRALAASSSSAL